MHYRGPNRDQGQPYCRGVVMFGAVGNPDHDESIRIIRKALDRTVARPTSAPPPEAVSAAR
ncbi:hypothetical protein [Nocardia amamiensis]|uniref:hypothetical protein n=1 Tax=Nocardia amamiensis TaxID=404578 RepID=UPI0033EB5A99